MRRIVEVVKRALRRVGQFNKTRFADYPYCKEITPAQMEGIKKLPADEKVKALQDLQRKTVRDAKPRILDRLYRIAFYIVAFIVLLPVWILLVWIIDDLYPQFLSFLCSIICQD